MEEDIPSWDISPVFYYYSGVAAAFYNIFLLFPRKIGQMVTPKLTQFNKEELCKRSLSRRPLYTHLVA